MIHPIELRGFQTMINEIAKDKLKFTTILKWLAGLSALGFVIHFPDVIAHGIIWIVHTFYEATSYVLEHFLTHNFGLNKDWAQLIVFYFSVVTGVVATVLFWRFWFKDYLYLKLFTLKYRVFYFWHSKQTGEKIKLILIHSALMISAFMFLLS